MLVAIDKLGPNVRVEYLAGSPIVRAVTIKNFLFKLLAFDIKLPIEPYYWRHIEYDQQVIFSFLSFASIYNYRLSAMIEINPFKSVFIKLVFVQCLFGSQ